RLGALAAIGQGRERDRGEDEASGAVGDGRATRSGTSVGQALITRPASRSRARGADGRARRGEQRGSHDGKCAPLGHYRRGAFVRLRRATSTLRRSIWDG